MVNEFVKPRVIGEKLEEVLLSLMNSMKNENAVLIIMRLGNITSILKRKLKERFGE